MLRKSLLVLAFLPLMAIPAFAATPAAINCEGSLIEAAGMTPAAMHVALTLGSPPRIDTGNGARRASVVSNSKIQLKFVTPEFTGEYFRYTGDLFLIYKSGHLARLTCSGQ